MHVITGSGLTEERRRMGRMGLSAFTGVRVAGVGSYLPPTILTNEEIAAEIAETAGGYAGMEAGAQQALTPEQVKAVLDENIGTTRRHVAGEFEWSEHMMAEAGMVALKDAGISPGAVDMVYSCPNPKWMNVSDSHCITANMMGLREGIGGSEMNVACTGNIEAIKQACYDLTNGNAECVLVTGANAMGPVRQKRLPFARATDRGIFGDGGGALVLVRDESHTHPTFIQRRDDHKHWLRIVHQLWKNTPIQIPEKNALEMFGPCDKDTLEKNVAKYIAAFSQGFHMQGKREWFDNWVRDGFGPHVLQFMEEVEITKNGEFTNPPDLFLPHQPNKGLAVKTIAWSGLDRFDDRKMWVYDDCADLISGECGVAFGQAKAAGRLTRGKKVLVYIYGAGFTQGNMYLEY